MLDTRTRVANRVAMPGRKRLPTSQDVAKLAGVSTAAVSYVFNGRANRSRAVGEETRRKVIEAAEQLGYQPNHLARGLRRQRSQLVAVVRTPGSVPTTDVLVQQLTTTAEARDYSVLSLMVESEQRVSQALRLLQQRVVDGAIITAMAFRMPAAELASIGSRGVALIVFDERMRPNGFDVVRQGQVEACRLAVQHLLDRGHRRIAYLSDQPARVDRRGSTRYSGFRRAHQASGVDIDPSIVVTGAAARETAYTATRELLALAQPPTAIFSATDRGAMAAIWACHDAGVAVPDDVAIVGVGGLPEGAVFKPTLTTVGQERLDYSSMIDRLFTRIDDPEGVTDETIKRPWRLVVRESS